MEGKGKRGFLSPVLVGSSQNCPPLAFGKRQGKEQKSVPGTSSLNKGRAEERNKARGRTLSLDNMN